jgi:hypothetical protein
MWFLKNCFSDFFYYCLLLKKLVNEKYFLINKKHFPVKEKFGLVFRKVFFFLRKTLSGSCEKFRNIILFADYIKFDLKLLIAIYIYIFFCFEYIFFNFITKNLIFFINFGPYFYNFYLLFPYHFLIEIFFLSNLVLILLIVTYFIWNNLWNVNYYYFNFFIY